MALSYVAQSARGIANPAVPQSRIDQCDTIIERFMTRWRGEPDPAHVRAVDAYFVSAAEHGMNASTFTARVIASTGADVAACDVRRDRRDERPAARRRPGPRAADDRRGREAAATPARSSRASSTGTSG